MKTYGMGLSPVDRCENEDEILWLSGELIYVYCFIKNMNNIILYG